MNHFHKIWCFHKTEYKSDVHSIPQSHISVFVLPIYLLSQMIRIQNYKFKFRPDKSVCFSISFPITCIRRRKIFSLFFGLTAQQQTTTTFPILFLTKIVQDKFPHAIDIDRASDRSRKNKKVKFRGIFSGQIRGKVGRISRDFSGQTSPKSNR